MSRIARPSQVTPTKTYEQELQQRDMRQKRFDSIVQAAMQRVVEAISGRTPSLKAHFFYGATGIHPRHLVTWYLFFTNADWQTAKASRSCCRH